MVDVQLQGVALGKINGADDFEAGSNDDITVNHHSSLTINGSFTLSAWLKPESLPAGGVFGTIIDKALGQDANYFLEQVGDEIDTGFHDGTTYRQHTSTSANLMAGTWYNIIGVFDTSDNRVRMHLNGNQLFDQTQTNEPTTNTGALSIGRVHGQGYFVDGIIDEVRISSAARSPEWIATEYNNQSSPSTFMSFGAESIETGGLQESYLRRHLLNNSAPSATSNHTLYFTVDSDVASTGGSATESMVISLDPDFDISSINCGDVDLEIAGTPTSIAVSTDRAANTQCPGTSSS